MYEKCMIGFWRETKARAKMTVFRDEPNSMHGLYVSIGAKRVKQNTVSK